MPLAPSPRPISRRTAVTAIAAALPAVATIGLVNLGFGACRGDDRVSLTAAGARQRLPAALDDATIRRIGEGWRQSHPAESTAAALQQAVQAARRRHRRFPWQPLPSLAQVLAAEYEAGATALPDGWVVAETEARLCALVALG